MIADAVESVITHIDEDLREINRSASYVGAFVENLLVGYERELRVILLSIADGKTSEPTG